MEKEITVFICEDDQTRDLIIDYIKEGKITFVQIFSADKRDNIIKALNEIEE